MRPTASPSSSTTPLQTTTAVERYVTNLSQANTEPARSQNFVLLLNDLFEAGNPGIVGDYLEGLEKYVTTRGKGELLYRGRIDALYGAAVIEFERDLNVTGDEARRQLREYVAALWSNTAYRSIPYLAIAADGQRFEVYTPSTTADQATLSAGDIELTRIARDDFARLTPDQIFFWLDRYLFRTFRRLPRSEEFERDFGPSSPAFQFTLQALRRAWTEHRDSPELQVVYQGWDRFLRIAYGTEVTSGDLFLRHTYLASVAKLLAWLRLDPPASESAASDATIEAVLHGRYFRELAITNFLAEDFFSWLARPALLPITITAMRRLVQQLRTYDLSALSEDILKTLYQELVDPATRRDLGEFYTPDWLAERILRDLLELDARQSVLDPACGSGTFLYTAVRLKREALGDSPATLAHIEENVTGIDVHPLATIISGTNFLLGLGNLLQQRSGPLRVPVYLANAVQLPEVPAQPRLGTGLVSYDLDIDGTPVSIPVALAEDSATFDGVIDAADSYARDWAGSPDRTETSFVNLLRREVPSIFGSPEYLEAAWELAQRFRSVVEADRNHIWAFAMKNAYKPVGLRMHFDLVVGNPPWLTYKDVDRGAYQTWLKREVVVHYRLLDSSRQNLTTHMEMASLFLVRTADLYLRAGGRIAFVMPRSVFNADQHHKLRLQTYTAPLTLTDIWDLQDVAELFRIPSCVVFGRRTADLSERDPYPISGQILTGRLPSKNASLAEAQAALSTVAVEFRAARLGDRSYLTTDITARQNAGKSPYSRLFREGASIVPRNLWFVEPRSGALGMNATRPVVETVVLPGAKAGWRDVTFRHAVEREYLFSTMLAEDILPFVPKRLRTVVLPAVPTATNTLRVIEAVDAQRLGSTGLASWLRDAERAWKNHRGDKAELMSVYERLDFQRLLTSQPVGGSKVVYSKSAAILCACRVDADRFVADNAVYVAVPNTPEEADFLLAFLNSPVVDSIIKPLLTMGLLGERNIHSKVWDVPIPRYNPDIAEHRELSALAAQAREHAGTLQVHAPSLSIGRLRQWYRAELRAELDAIGVLISRVIS